MAQDEKLIVTKQTRPANKDWILWTLVGTFIVVSIVVMLGVDYYYAADLSNPANLPEAVGK